jgi:hypothetical protein
VRDVKEADHVSHHERWALLRFSVVGQLLAAPPPEGELRAEIKKLAAREWQHPITDLPMWLRSLYMAPVPADLALRLDLGVMQERMPASCRGWRG